MAGGSLLSALFQNESGGRNVANTTQGTASGQAQGYFQITEGTWNDFGGRKYAPNPLAASYAQQAEIAAKIPLKRWDESTIAKMRATGKPIDPNKTLGENLVANGENIATTPDMTTSSGAARHPQNPQVGRADAAAPAAAAVAATQDLNDEYEALLASRPAEAAEMPSSLLADTMASSVSQRPDPGGITASAADQDAALQPIDLASAAMPEAPAVVRDQPAAPALADLFKVKDIGLANLTDPISGQPRLLRTRRAYG